MSNAYQSDYKGREIDQAVKDSLSLKERIGQAEKDIQYLTTYKANANTVPKRVTDLEQNASFVYIGKNEPSSSSNISLWVYPVDDTQAVLKVKNANGNWVEVAGGKSDSGGGVYIGSGDMPENCNLQIDPDGEAFDIEGYITSIINRASSIKTVTINLLSSAWIQESSNQYSQVVLVPNITPYSKIDLQPTPAQLAIFHEKDIAFVTENDEKKVTVYCIGQKPVNDYEIQATIMEVEIDG